MINYSGGEYILNGIDMYAEYGFVVTSGVSDFLKLPKRKDGYSYSWPGENGTEFDLISQPVYEDQQVTIKGYMVAEDQNDFLVKRYRLFRDMTVPGTLNLHVSGLNQTFKTFYIDMTSSEMATRIYDTPLLAWSVSVQFQLVNFSVDEVLYQMYLATNTSGQVILQDGYDNLIRTK